MRLIVVIAVAIALPSAATDVARLDWLTGCWSYDHNDPGSGEIWMSAAGGTLIAISRTVRDSDHVDFPMTRVNCVVLAG